MHPQPETMRDERYSAPGVRPTDWDEGSAPLGGAELYWLSTVRTDGRPDVTPLIAVWWNRAVHFCTTPHGRRARHLAGNLRCLITPGCNRLGDGLDLVVEGRAEPVADEGLLQPLATEFATKYGPEWSFEVRGGAFNGEGGRVLVHRLVPVTAFGFATDVYAQTRRRFRNS